MNKLEYDPVQGFDLKEGAARCERELRNSINYEQYKTAKRYRELYEETAERLTKKYVKKDLRLLVIVVGFLVMVLITLCFHLLAPR